jgi:protein TonB
MTAETNQRLRRNPGASPFAIQACDAWWLAGIVALHAAFIGAILAGSGNARQIDTPPQIIGMLVSDVAAPTSNTPEPRRVQPERVQKQAAAKPPPLQPVRNAPPSKHAPTVSEQPADTTPIKAASSNSGTPPPQAAISNSGQVTLPRTDAAHMNNPKPVYPAVSRRLSEQGTVQLSVYILPDGKVGEVQLKVSSGYPRLDQSAIDAVRAWRYIPARRGNEPIPYWYTQPVRFSLDS